MFYLWIGVMAGVVLAYLMTSRWPERRWTLAQWWIAVGIAFSVLVPVSWDFIRTAWSGLGLIDAMKSVLLPWAAGVGFGVWMSLITLPIRRKATATSWIPVLVSLLFVTMIVSDERYNWFARLQKITFGGGGVEFSSAPASTPLSPDASAVAVSGAQQGEGRIGTLVSIMASLADFISRDQGYAKEIGFPYKDEDFQKDIDFARSVVAPLGDRLEIIHGARGYNNIATLIDRSFVENFRALTQGYGQNVLARVADSIKTTWQQTCDTELQLRAAGFVAPKPSHSALQHFEECKNEEKRAISSIDAATAGPTPRGFFNPALPYGTLLSAMLLNAAGEIEPGAADLERWAILNRPELNKPDDQYKWFGVYRAQFYSARLLANENRTGALHHLLVMRHQKVVQLGQWLLTSPSSSPMSWRAQIARLEGDNRIAALWRPSACASDLSSNFKRLMLANLTMKNNYVYFLSENLAFAKNQGLVEEMDEYGKYLAAVNTRCLQQDPHSDEARAYADSTKASFLDTSANIELMLAAGEDDRLKKRARLCQALHHVEKAISLYHQIASARQAPAPTKSNAMPWEVSAARQVTKRQFETLETGLILLRRHERVKAQLVQNSIDC